MSTGRLEKMKSVRTPGSNAAVMGFLVLAMSCGDLKNPWRRLTGRHNIVPDSVPVLAVDSLPFHYPVALYIQQIQDNVTLRLYVDAFGRPVPESTRVETHSKYAEFDSSALNGAKDLVFRPAFAAGQPIPWPVLFPIKYRVPNGPPLPGDESPNAK